MASRTDIANRALSKVGEPRISNIDTQDIKSARTISDMWDIVRDSLIAQFPWNFSLKRAQLAADATAPLWGYANNFTVPVDFLSLVQIQNDPKYSLEYDGGLKIATDANAPLFIQYVSQVTNTSDFDPLFTEAFSTKLAMESAEIFSQSNSKKQILAAQFQDDIATAYASDSIQSNPQFMPEDEWILSRNSGSNFDLINYGSND